MKKTVFLLSFLLILSGCHFFFTKDLPHLTQNKPSIEELQKVVQKILKIDVTVSNLMTLRNGGEDVFDIRSSYFPGKITFSYDYLCSDPKSSEIELLLMVDLKKKYPMVQSVTLWNARTGPVFRIVNVSGNKIELDRDWKTVVNHELCVWSFHCMSDICLILYENVLDETLIKNVAGLNEETLTSTLGNLWGMSISENTEPLKV